MRCKTTEAWLEEELHRSCDGDTIVVFRNINRI